MEPLIQDTLNKGHNTFNLFIKDKFCGSYSTIAMQFLPLREDNLCITVKLCQNWLVPKYALFKSFTVFVTCVISHSKRDHFTIVPVLVGALKQDSEKLYGEIFSRYLMDPANLFIISSDFCHWGKYSTV